MVKTSYLIWRIAFPSHVEMKYRTRAIISHSWLEAALEYKPNIRPKVWKWGKKVYKPRLIMARVRYMYYLVSTLWHKSTWFFHWPPTPLFLFAYDPLFLMVNWRKLMWKYKSTIGRKSLWSCIAFLDIPLQACCKVWKSGGGWRVVMWGPKIRGGQAIRAGSKSEGRKPPWPPPLLATCLLDTTYLFFKLFPFYLHSNEIFNKTGYLLEI